MKRRFWIRTLGACAALTALAWSGRSDAQEAKGFGERGQLIISADRLFPLFSYTSVSTTETRDNNTTVTTTDKGSSFVMLIGAEPEVSSIHTVPRVAVDFTVIPRLTIGGSIVLAFGLGGSHNVDTTPQNGPKVSTSTDAASRTIIGFGPRVGYILPLGDLFAFWPRGGFSFYSVREREVDNGNGQPNQQTTITNTDTLFSLDLDPQFCIIPIQHFFFNAGPLINIPLSGSRSNEVTAGSTTTKTSIDLSVFHFGISVGLGGWFDL
jgi:hypothetical protein